LFTHYVRGAIKGVSVNYSNIVCGVYCVSIKVCYNYTAAMLEVITPSSVSRIRPDIYIYMCVCVCIKCTYIRTSQKGYESWICYILFPLISFPGRDETFCLLRNVVAISAVCPAFLLFNGFLPGSKAGVKWTSHLHLVTRLRMSVAVPVRALYTHPSLFAVSPQDKSTSPGPFSRQGHKIFLTNQTGIRAVPRDV
jgi:hypothetical protein